MILNPDNKYQIGGQALQKISQKPAAVVHSIKQILGKDFDDKVVQDLKGNAAFSIIPDAQKRV